MSVATGAQSVTLYGEPSSFGSPSALLRFHYSSGPQCGRIIATEETEEAVAKSEGEHKCEPLDVQHRGHS